MRWWLKATAKRKIPFFFYIYMSGEPMSLMKSIHVYKYEYIYIYIYIYIQDL